ncbi:MAG: uL15 family ribosomal protein [Patescibacteria group bacterium]
MQTHQVKREHPQRQARQVGRGGKRGKTAGRGTKGQLARAGRKLRPELRDIIKKIPKRRGYGKNRAIAVDGTRVNPAVVNLGILNKYFETGATINPAALLEKELIRRHAGALPAVKILATGPLQKSFNFFGCEVSVSAREKIEKAGGKIA